MNISMKLAEQGMVRIGKNREANGFDKVVTFVLPDFVKEILTKKYRLQHSPDIAIIRRGIVKSKGRSIGRQDNKKRLMYSLAYYDKELDSFKIVTNDIGEKVKRVLGSMTEYVTSEGDLFTAEKYM